MAEEEKVKVIITLERYEELLENEEWLNALEAAGVDNWEGYDAASDIFQKNSK